MILVKQIETDLDYNYVGTGEISARCLPIRVDVYGIEVDIFEKRKGDSFLLIKEDLFSYQQVKGVENG